MQSKRSIAMALAIIISFSTSGYAAIQVSDNSGGGSATVSDAARASRSVSSTQGASAVIERKAAQEDAAMAATATAVDEIFLGTSANFHAEDQCRIADVAISRFVPPIGQQTTFLSYNIRNFCDESLSGIASIEVPDASFVGDPRKDNFVRMTVDLTAVRDQVQGNPLVADVTFVKEPTLINRSSSRSISTRRNSTGKLTTKFVNTSVFTTATVGGKSDAFPLPTTGNISWDDTKNVTETDSPDNGSPNQPVPVQ